MLTSLSVFLYTGVCKVITPLLYYYCAFTLTRFSFSNCSSISANCVFSKSAKYGCSNASVLISSSLIKLQHLLQQINPVFVQLWYNFSQVLRFPLRKLVPISQFCHPRPHRFVRCSQQPKNATTVAIRITWKQRLLPGHFRENASDRPNIHGCGIMRPPTKLPALDTTTSQSHACNSSPAPALSPNRDLQSSTRCSLYQPTSSAVLNLCASPRACVNARCPIKLVHEVLHRRFRQRVRRPLPVSSIKCFKSWFKYSKTK